MLQILDSTLREGEQTPGVYFSPDKKMIIAQFLDQIGVDIIEVGNPAVDREIALAITRISQAGLKAKIGAHSLCKIDHVQKISPCAQPLTDGGVRNAKHCGSIQCDGI